MNKVILLGRLTRDPELKTTGTGVSVATFSLAVNRPYAKDADKTADFFNIVTWRKTAEFVCNYFKKGSQIALVGRLQERSYDDKDGIKRYVVEVVADEVFFADSKRDNGNMGQPAAPVAVNAREVVENVSNPVANDNDFFPTSDDDLPF